MKRFSTFVKSTRGSKEESASSSLDPPEKVVERAVKAFCESSATSNAGEEVTQLPLIVEGAESSPRAAAAAAQNIRKYLSERNRTKPQAQYNAIMLIGILSNNPGPSFTQNVDKKFVDTVKSLLVQSQDPSVQTMMRDTLATLERDKANDTNLSGLIEMWQKAKAEMQQSNHGYNNFAMQQQQLLVRATRHGQPRISNSLPPPEELAGRVEEARTTAKLLIQLSQSTPPGELASSDLAQEFAGRCQEAQRNLQGYMNCTNPGPDEETFQTLIESCEQLNVANSKYQRALLAARRLHSNTPPVAAPNAESNANGYFAPPAASRAVSPPAPAAPIQSPYGMQQQKQPRSPPPQADALTTQQYSESRTLREPLQPTPVSSAPRDLNPFSDDNRIARDGFLAETNGTSAPTNGNMFSRSTRTTAQPPPLTTQNNTNSAAAVDEDDLYGFSAPATQQRSTDAMNAFSTGTRAEDPYSAPAAVTASPATPQGPGNSGNYSRLHELSYPTPSTDYPYPSPIGGGMGPTWGETATPSGPRPGAGRVKDDEPFTPAR